MGQPRLSLGRPRIGNYQEQYIDNFSALAPIELKTKTPVLNQQFHHYANPKSDVETYHQVYHSEEDMKDNSQATAITSQAKPLREKKRPPPNKAVVPAVVVPGLVN